MPQFIRLMKDKLNNNVILILLPFLFVTILAGCGPTLAPVQPPAANQPPTACIDSITPNEAAEGEAVTFIGHGTDPQAGIASPVVAVLKQLAMDI